MLHIRHRARNVVARRSTAPVVPLETDTSLLVLSTPRAARGAARAPPPSPPPSPPPPPLPPEMTIPHRVSAAPLPPRAGVVPSAPGSPSLPNVLHPMSTPTHPSVGAPPPPPPLAERSPAISTV